MIESLLQVIDRLIQYRQLKDKRLKNVYEQLLEPAFEDLLQIHGDYVQMFEEVAELLESQNSDLLQPPVANVDKAAKYLREARVKFEPVRAKLRAMREVLKEKPLPKGSEEFVEALIRYFPSGLPEWSSHSAYVLHSLDIWRDQRKKTHSAEPLDKNVVADLTGLVETKITNLRLSWSYVCEAFARLRMKVATRE